MIDQKALFAAFLYSLILDGRYLPPAMLTALFFGSLPFRWEPVNIAVSGVFGVLILSLWSLRLTDWNWFSYKFFLHILTYCFILLASIYIFHEKKNQS